MLSVAPSKQIKEFMTRQAIRLLTGQDLEPNGNAEVVEMGVSNGHFIIKIELKQIDLSKESMK